MQKKLIAAAVAGLIAVPALAQSNVTISGTMNMQFENSSASGATAAASSIKSRSRMVENASELRFSGVESLGGGLDAFFTIGVGFDPNYSNRTNNWLNESTGQALNPDGTFGQVAARNTGVGLRSKTWGEILIGRWDVHYGSHGGVDGFNAKSGLAMNSLAILHGPLGVGGRLSNTIRYVTPTWNGFAVTASYSRPIESTSRETGALTDADLIDKKHYVWNVNPTYNNGPWHAFYSYYKEQNRDLTNVGPLFSGALGDYRGDRAGLAYTFGNVGGGALKLGLIWDRSKRAADMDAAANTRTIRRTAWAIPVSYEVGPHTFGLTYAKANNVNVSNSNGTSGAALEANSGAHYWMLGYQYALSKRTNLSLGYAKIRNDSAAAYDFFANSGVGMCPSTAGASICGLNTSGADPRTVQVGIRHAF